MAMAMATPRTLIICGTDTRRIVHRDVQLALPVQKGPKSPARGHRLLGRCLWPEMPMRPGGSQEPFPEVPESPYIEWYVFSRKREEVREFGCLLQEHPEGSGAEDTLRR